MSLGCLSINIGYVSNLMFFMNGVIIMLLFLKKNGGIREFLLGIVVCLYIDRVELLFILSCQDMRLRIYHLKERYVV